ncbi:MAG: electron transfer flavoprotein subunit beta/FixA family protein [Candidatus Omnitrophica bacterium]|nr:electron transfer flavoprotein subunit beta/FixA family protein [Candidatus Omnitrophota bacterium]
MNIIVCIKQVPETTEVKIDPVTKRIVREGVKGIINPYDSYALEEAIRLKERFGGQTTVISMGPPQAESALREALAMGIDRAILLSDRLFAGSDTLATSYILASAIRKLVPFEIIICGRETLDGSTGQVGPGIAFHLGIPYATFVSGINQVADGQLECVRLMEDHYETLALPLPSLITVVKEINEPRLPSLRGLLRAKKAEIPVWGASNISGKIEFFGQEGSPTRVVECWHPEIKAEGKVVKGEPEQLAQILYETLKEKGLV